MDDLNEIIREKLDAGVVAFAYEKKDGSWRNAIGTRNKSVIEMVDGTLPTGSGREHVGVIPYWDIEQCGWRCFGSDSIIEIKECMNPMEYRKFLNINE